MGEALRRPITPQNWNGVTQIGYHNIMKRARKPKIIVIVGPTASGKSDLAVKLAKKINAEVVSADSRQVYRGMDIGTGKVPISYELQSGESTKSSAPPFRRNSEVAAYYKGIRHHMIDVASPKRTFTVKQYVQLAEKAVASIVRRGKMPIIAGGTGFYIHVLADGIVIPAVPPNPKLRKQLENKTAAKLFEILQKLDSRRASNIDRNNKRRLVRAIEIVKMLGSVPKLTAKPQYDALYIGIQKSPAELRKRIKCRLLERLKQDMIDEVKKLRKSEVSWKRLEGFGLEYRYIARYLRKKLSYQEMVRQLELAIWHYAKRQMTWFKKDQRIHWVTNEKEALQLVKEFLRKRSV
jgi:tRNA dimethylallyltransferase